MYVCLLKLTLLALPIHTYDGLTKEPLTLHTLKKKNINVVQDSKDVCTPSNEDVQVH